MIGNRPGGLVPPDGKFGERGATARLSPELFNPRREVAGVIEFPCATEAAPSFWSPNRFTRQTSWRGSADQILTRSGV